MAKTQEELEIEEEERQLIADEVEADKPENVEKRQLSAELTPQQLASTLADLKILFGDDEDLMLFFLKWLQNGRNATQAYLDLHPDVTYLSAKTLGSRMVKKIDLQSILLSYGLDFDVYFTQLKEGLAATRIHGTDDNFIEIPDHKVRKDYHDKLGKLLEIEKTEGVKAEVNINNIIGNWVKGGES